MGDVRDWHQRWKTSPIAGDCRYWPLSAWLVSLYGPETLQQRPDLVAQYESRLDSYALGIMALELICTPAIATEQDVANDSLRGSWRRLLSAWTKFRDDVSRWHLEIHEVFSQGGSMGPLCKRLAEEQLVEHVENHNTTLCAGLRACIDRTTDQKMQNLLWVIAELLEDCATIDISRAVKVLSGEGVYPQKASSSRLSRLRQRSRSPSPRSLTDVPASPRGVTSVATTLS